MDRKRSVRRSRRYRPFAKRCKDLCRNFVAFMFSNVGIIGLVISYTISGAVIFRTIEKTRGVNPLTVRVNMTRNATASDIWTITLSLNRIHPADEGQYRNAVDSALRAYQDRIVRYHRNESYLGLKEDNVEKWTFARAFLYSLTVITTIGYGNIFPMTYEGKIATIVYAIVGMPLFLLYLSNIGDIMARSFKWVYANCCLCRWCPRVAKKREERKKRRAQIVDDDDDEDDVDEETPESRLDDVRSRRSRPSIVSDASGVTGANTEDDDEDDDQSYDIQTVTVPVTICLAIMVGYICGGALLFCTWENWEFLDASYFCFISLSTIGFGDLVPGENIYGHKRHDDTEENLVKEMLELKFVFCSMYLMLGMALIAMCFNLMQEEVVHKIQTTARTIKYVLGCHR